MWNTGADLLVSGRAQANQTVMQFVYVIPFTWYTFTLYPPVDYYATMIVYSWADLIPNCAEGYAQHPQTIFHYTFATADWGMAGFYGAAISTWSQPGLMMYRNIDIIPHCAIISMAHFDYKTKEDAIDALNYIDKLSAHTRDVPRMDIFR